MEGFEPKLDVSEQGADLALEGGDLALDSGLETACLLSLFTERRLRDDPGEGEPRGGWWGESADDRWGSLLWTASRAVATTEVLETARSSCREALTWLVEEGILERVEVDAEVQGDELLVEVRLVRGSATRWDRRWAGVQATTYRPGGPIVLRLLPL